MHALRFVAFALHCCLEASRRRVLAIDRRPGGTEGVGRGSTLSRCAFEFCTSIPYRSRATRAIATSARGEARRWPAWLARAESGSRTILRGIRCTTEGRTRPAARYHLHGANWRVPKRTTALGRYHCQLPDVVLRHAHSRNGGSGTGQPAGCGASPTPRRWPHAVQRGSDKFCSPRTGRATRCSGRDRTDKRRPVAGRKLELRLRPCVTESQSRRVVAGTPRRPNERECVVAQVFVANDTHGDP